MLPLAVWLDARRRPCRSPDVLAASCARASCCSSLGEVTLTHPTAHARLAIEEMTGGRYRGFFWAGVALVGARGRRAVARRGRPRRWRSPASSPTSTRTSRPANRCRSLRRRRWRRTKRKSARVGGKARHGGSRRDVLSGAERDRSRRVSPEGALGRLGRARFARVAEARRAPLHARADHVLQLRVGLRPSRLRRQGLPRDPQVRGQSRASRLSRPELRQGAGDAEPGVRSAPHPPSSEAQRRARRGEVAARLLGRGARRHRGAHPSRDPGGQAQRGRLSRRSAGRGRLHRARARRMGPRRPQLAHQHLLVERTRRLSLLDGARPAEPGLRERRRHRADQRAPRVGTLLQSPRAADHRGEEARREDHRLRRASLEHRHARRLLGLAVSGNRAGDPPGDRRPSDPPPALRSRVRAALVELARVHAREASRPRADVRELRARARTTLRELHVRVRRRRIRGRCEDDRRARRRRLARAHAPGDAQLAERGGRQSRRLASVAHALPAERAARRDRHGGRDASERRQQVRAAPDPRARASAGVERPQLAGRISAGDERDVDACCRIS